MAIVVATAVAATELVAPLMMIIGDGASGDRRGGGRVPITSNNSQYFTAQTVNYVGFMVLPLL